MEHQNPSMTYEPETPADLFRELEAALGMRPDYRRAYNAMSQTFTRSLALLSAPAGLRFGGTFAATDYVLKEHAAPPSLAKAVNDTRVRLRKRGELPIETLQHCCLCDAGRLARFIGLGFGVSVPEALAKAAQEELPTGAVPTTVSQSVRAIVRDWDDDYVYVQTAEPAADSTAKVAYRRAGGGDWTYLKSILCKGAQLNLVRPRTEGGALVPELMIYEPDYLIDISAVARCFTNYADSPLVGLIRRLEPQKTAEPLVMGNLAGQLLDEAIHQLPESHTYAESVRTFFRSNAVSLLTTALSPGFHQEACQQRQNIRQAISVTLPAALKRFDPMEGIVEPSFFSEMLGLQGRMDYLQMDFRVLLEQKSGKGGFPYDGFVRPRQTDEHYVQMLLYMALIRYSYNDVYERNRRELHAFLLYSKYAESLLGLGFAPELMFRAFKVRNELAWMEMNSGRGDGYRLLERLTPDELNTKHASGKLWSAWQRPQLAAILDPIKQASPVERAYFFRFMAFISCEHTLAKLGSSDKEGSGFASTWRDAVEEKRLAGNIFDQLTLTSPNDDTAGQVETVELKFAETAAQNMANFRKGDIVVLYPYDEGKEPNACKSIVMRCTIEDIGSESIRLTLRAPQGDSRYFLRERRKLWAIEHDFMESSFSWLYRAMHAFLTAPQDRRRLLLLQREPLTDSTRTLKGDYGEFNALALNVKRAKDFFLVIGPPGTGKTSYGLLYTVKEELLEPGSSILLLSYTNRAVDEICSKLAGHGIEFIRIGSRFGCAEEYRDRLLSSKVEQSQGLASLKALLHATRVIVGTTTALNSQLQLLQLKQFSLAIIDEASQILEPHLIGLLSAHTDGTPAIRKFVMIGDQKQLPAVVGQDERTSRVDDRLLRDDVLLTDCRLSLFERLLRRYARNEQVTYMLTKQGRMHHDIAQFPNMAFYNNQLRVVPLAHQNADLPTRGEGKNGIADLLATRRIAFIAADTPKDSPSDKVNQTEADMIAAMVVKIYEIEQSHGFDVDRTVGVIVPYRNQIATIRSTIDKYGISDLHDISIDTVERFQGSQRKYIIYGFTIQKYYQLKFLTSNVFEDIDGTIVDRKLNVAMTRAEEHLMMVGNAELLSHNYTFSWLMEFMRSKQAFLRINRDDFVAGRFLIPQPEAAP